ncbi:serine hydrolase [Streptomyces lucensis JCM 4490]|uniref:Serine hydrolase n=1 Tax=Streptomyces lucensis JCM 4490 TaxID=1306176 RepID=A0A918J9E6_9ACTN|nr:serine hydrolase domain-containing protein [Streptomyces lucensis]GGW63602.1 serine hydrolase [Streptomyces lucensis JCM 4490]
MTIGVHGTVADGFEGVREKFASMLARKRADPGAQLVVYRHGRRVVDLWGGDRIDGDTLTSQYSIAKGAAHLVVALLVQDGSLDLDREVASYWPEFGVNGKDRLTVRQLLEHRAGLVGDAERAFTVEELADDRTIAARLARRTPLWEPGTAYGYHAFVIGALTGEVVRRVTGRTLQEVYEERVRAPYGLDYYLGLPAGAESRWVEVQPLEPTGEEAVPLKERTADPDALQEIALNAHGPQPVDLVAFGNHPRVRALGPASSGGVGNARGIAGLYAAVLGPVGGRPPLLTAETARLFGGLRTPGPDLVTGNADHFALGFEYLPGLYPFLGAGTLGHSGATGSLGFADPEHGIAYAYAQRRFAFPSGVGAAVENGRLAQSVLRAAAAL